MSANELEFGDNFRADPEAPVKTSGVVVVIGEIISRAEKPDVALPADITLQAKNSDVRVFVDKALDTANGIQVRIGASSTLAVAQSDSFIRRIIARRVIRGIHQTESVFAAPARQFRSNVRVNYRASVHDVHSSLKNIDSLQKERSFFLKENRETLIRGNDRRVGFDLGKIGIICSIERDVRCDVELQIDADVLFNSFVNETTGIQS